jgi:hypothetical protein
LILDENADAKDFFLKLRVLVKMRGTEAIAALIANPSWVGLENAMGRFDKLSEQGKQQLIDSFSKIINDIGFDNLDRVLVRNFVIKNTKDFFENTDDLFLNLDLLFLGSDVIRKKLYHHDANTTLLFSMMLKLWNRNKELRKDFDSLNMLQLGVLISGPIVNYWLKKNVSNLKEYLQMQSESLKKIIYFTHNKHLKEIAIYMQERIANLDYLLSSNSISIDVRSEYEKTVRQICKILDPWFKETKTQRIHGDCHFGNLLFRGEEAFFIDFDDMVVGPPVQDVWLLTPGRDEYSDRLRNRLLSGYEQMREFDWDSLKLVEGLRALRLIHFSAWIAKRWQDPAFQRTFIQYGTPRYWEEQLADLKDQLSWIQKES